MKHAHTPWWLESGTEMCDFCLQTFHYEAGYYCVHCDRPVCAICMVTLHGTRRVVCPDCQDEEET